ncbi:hypothetical protein AB205_0162450, partial [Aquarana catesbeiana]
HVIEGGLGKQNISSIKFSFNDYIYFSEHVFLRSSMDPRRRPWEEPQANYNRQHDRTCSQTLYVGKCVMEPTHGRNFRQQGPITHFPSENPTVCTGHMRFILKAKTTVYFANVGSNLSCIHTVTQMLSEIPNVKNTVTYNTYDEPRKMKFNSQCGSSA